MFVHSYIPIYDNCLVNIPRLILQIEHKCFNTKLEQYRSVGGFFFGFVLRSILLRIYPFIPNP